MSSTSSYIETTYSEDERYQEYRRKKRYEAIQEELKRKQTFEQISRHQDHNIFKLQGINIMKFTQDKIKFCFQPSELYEFISQKYKFYCSFRYLRRYRKWIIKREPMPATPIYYKVTRKSVFIEDDLTELYAVILRIYSELRRWSEHEIRYRNNKYKRFKKGELSYLDIDSVDEELYFSDDEREALFRKRNTVLQRMIPPRRRPQRKRTAVKYII